MCEMGGDDSILPVLIVGAGPVGLVLSILLTKLGVKCAILEKRKAFSTHPKAHIINNRSMEVFRKLDGLADDILKSQPPVDSWENFVYCTSLTGRILGSVDHNMQPQAIFNFGDSNSDTGGLSAAFGQAPFPNGKTFFHAPSGRFCDGRLIIDFIARHLRLPYLSAYLDSVGSNFRHGANFATAGSTIRPQNTTMSQSGVSPISLDVQSVQFSDFRRRSRIMRRRGWIHRFLLPKQKAFSSALYTFDIGQNDLTAGYKLNMSTEQVKAYVLDVLNQFSKAIKNIYAQGGRAFWIHNTGPVGCLPYVMDRFLVTAAQIDKYGCASPFNQVAQYFNRRLKATVFDLRRALPEAAITYVDVYSVKYTLITRAGLLGFVNPFLACCGHGGKYNYNRFIKCGAKKIINGTEIVLARSCRFPKLRVSWDGTHFTERANRWIFHRIVNGEYSDPPLPLRFACNRTTSN